MPDHQISSTENNTENDQSQREKESPAHQAADKDIKKDPDLNDNPSPEDSLDEGELARLEGQDDGEMDLNAGPEE
jgi:hypothetical protein